MAAPSFARFAAMAALLLAAAACKYPFEMDLPETTEHPFVVEGDILIGGSTTLNFRYAQPLKDEKMDLYQVMDTLHFRASGFIEGEDGTRVEGYLPQYVFTMPNGQVLTFKRETADILRFDTETLRPDQRYRLHLETISSLDRLPHTFETDWMEVRKAPVIDNLTFSKHAETNELWIGLSMHCNGSHHFRWSYEELWEYHSDLHASYYYDPQKRTVQYGDGDVYRCWQHDQSTTINIFSTENQTEDRFEDLAIYRIPRDDRRLSVLYRITLTLEAISEDSYNFWRTLRENTDEQGSIFAPTPSEMASNLRCISDPNYRVLGFVGTTGVTKAELYYDNEQEKFYKYPKGGYYFDPEESKEDNTDAMNAHQYNRNRRIWYGVWESEIPTPTPTHFIWVNAKCIDCRLSGGTTYKPADWPEKEGSHE